MHHNNGLKKVSPAKQPVHHFTGTSFYWENLGGKSLSIILPIILLGSENLGVKRLSIICSPSGIVFDNLGGEEGIPRRKHTGECQQEEECEC